MVKFLIFLVFVECVFGFNPEEFFRNASNECLQQYRKLNPITKAKMLDSSGTFPMKGLMSGNLYDLGLYDECLSIVDNTNEIYGKYCLAHPSPGIALKGELDKYMDVKKLHGFESMLSVGICIPNKCTSDDLSKSLKFVESDCSTSFTNNEMDAKAITALSIIYLLLIIVIVSTFYDFYIQRNNLKPRHDICIAFSAYTNGKKILTTSSRNDQLECLNGIKAISMIWVVLGHVYMNSAMPGSATTAIDNFIGIIHWKNQVINMFIFSAPLSVDTFFTVGGLLTVYVYMKSSDDLTIWNLGKIPLLYLHRYLRLTPAFGMMILIYATGLFKYVGNGPNWSKLNSSQEVCEEHWWSALLYIQNYVGISKMCISQSWYLSVDFQLFLLTPFVLIPMKKYPKYTILGLFLLVVVGVLIPFSIGYNDNLSGIGAGMVNPDFANYYFSTHTRFAPYVIGMIAGYFVFKLKNEETSSLHLNALSKINMWTLCILTLAFCIFDGFYFVKNQKYPHFNSDNRLLNGFYLGFNRPLWSCAVSLMVILCSTRNGGPINEFLAMPVFQILSKLSYSIYLVHYIVILMINSSTRTSWHFNNLTVMSQFFTHFIVTASIAILLCLICESPMITIERILFPRRRKNDNDMEIQHERMERNTDIKV